MKVVYFKEKAVLGKKQNQPTKKINIMGQKSSLTRAMCSLSFFFIEGM